MALGLGRAGWLGALAAWLGFTLPSALGADPVCPGRAQRWRGWEASGAVHGLKVVAVAVVAQAVWGMSKSLCPDRLRAGVAVGAALMVWLLPSAGIGQVVRLVLGGWSGWRALPRCGALAGGAAPGLRCEPAPRGAVLLTLFGPCWCSPCRCWRRGRL
jgi:chromate transporter